MQSSIPAHQVELERDPAMVTDPFRFGPTKNDGVVSVSCRTYNENSVCITAPLARIVYLQALRCPAISNTQGSEVREVRRSPPTRSNNRGITQLICSSLCLQMHLMGMQVEALDPSRIEKVEEGGNFISDGEEAVYEGEAEMDLVGENDDGQRWEKHSPLHRELTLPSAGSLVDGGAGVGIDEVKGIGKWKWGTALRLRENCRVLRRRWRVRTWPRLKAIVIPRRRKRKRLQANGDNQVRFLWLRRTPLGKAGLVGNHGAATSDLKHTFSGRLIKGKRHDPSPNLQISPASSTSSPKARGSKNRTPLSEEQRAEARFRACECIVPYLAALPSHDPKAVPPHLIHASLVHFDHSKPELSRALADYFREAYSADRNQAACIQRLLVTFTQRRLRFSEVRPDGNS